MYISMVQLPSNDDNAITFQNETGNVTVDQNLIMQSIFVTCNKEIVYF
jgi:hypothetical protein